MIKSLRKWYLTWLFRYNTIGEMATMLDNHTCHSRRCAYDLAHAASDLAYANHTLERMGNKVGYDSSDTYSDRAAMWKSTFSPRGEKMYRSAQANEIADLERTIARLRRLLEKHGINDPEEIPF